LAIHHEESKIHIVLDKSVLKWISFVFVIVLLGFSFYFYRKKQTEWMETGFRLHRASARTLLRHMQKKSNLSEVVRGRMRQAIHLLLNKELDDEVVITRCRVVRAGSHWPTISLSYVDEKLKVAHVKYIYGKSQTGDLEFTFVDTNEMPPLELRMRGVTDLLFSLKEDPNLTADSNPFLVEEDGRWYFACPEPFYKSILDRQGEFILLNKAKNVLDQVTLKELYIAEEK